MLIEAAISLETNEEFRGMFHVLENGGVVASFSDFLIQATTIFPQDPVESALRALYLRMLATDTGGDESKFIEENGEWLSRLVNGQARA